MLDNTNNFELRYYQTICQIQDDYIKGKISKKECEEKIEIERLKFISYLQIQSEQITKQIEQAEEMKKILTEIDKHFVEKKFVNERIKNKNEI